MIQFVSIKMNEIEDEERKIRSNYYYYYYYYIITYKKIINVNNSTFLTVEIVLKDLNDQLNQRIFQKHHLVVYVFHLKVKILI